MNINQRFFKYQGTGNDFVMIDDRDQKFPLDDKALINRLCDRRFGIGADGLILLQEAVGYDFRMVYFNADGSESTMCGNGGRCIVQFAFDLNVINENCSFIAIDGPHKGRVEGGLVRIQMTDVNSVKNDGTAYVLDTGSPHYVRLVRDVSHVDVKEAGKKIRYNETYAQEGININFVEVADDVIKVATYERGVEDETYSCGTGVVASVIATGEKSDFSRSVTTKGGDLEVSYRYDAGNYTDIWLSGPAINVFEGIIELEF